MKNTTAESAIETKPHYEILDGLRGVAAALVVAYHLFETYSGGDHTRQIINHGYLAVDFFFVLSGFVIGYAYDDRWGKGMSAWTFLRRRLVRLHPMLVLGTLSVRRSSTSKPRILSRLSPERPRGRCCS